MVFFVVAASLFPPGRFGDLDTLRKTTDAGAYLDYLHTSGYSFNAALISLLSRYIKQPPSLTSLQGSPVSAANYGSAGILPITWAYLALMGPDGLTAATKTAVLAANYLANALSDRYPVLYAGET